MTYLAIYNELAGGTSSSSKKTIQKFFEERSLPIRLHSVKTDGSFQDLNPNDYQRIITVGGDGTCKEVANWIIKKTSDTPLAIIPKGTGNLVAQSLDIPMSVEKALDLAVNGKVQPIDVGSINNRDYFLLAAGVGFDAKVIKNTSFKLKRILGLLAYMLGIIKSFFNLNTDKIFIKSEEFEGSQNVQSIFVSNIAQFFNLKINPEAKINDGMLNVSIFKPVSLKDLIEIIKRFLSGQHKKDWRYTYFQTKRIYILPYKKNTPIQIDGELVHPPYLDISIMPKALNIVTNKEL